MVENLILLYSRCNLIILSCCVLLSCFSIRSYSLGEADAFSTFSVSSFRYPETRLKPFDSLYFRVDLPPWFSSLAIVLESDVDIDARSIAKVPKSALPLICLRDGSLPLPEVTNTFVKGLVLDSLSNGSSNGLEDIQKEEQCYPMQKNITMKLTNEQISPGAWYLGFFNGIGAIRTQSKMSSNVRDRDYGKEQEELHKELGSDSELVVSKELRNGSGPELIITIDYPTSTFNHERPLIQWVYKERQGGTCRGELKIAGPIVVKS